MQSQSLIKRVEIILVTCILVLVYLSDLGEVEFHPDESQWIAASHIFESYVRMEFNSEAWDRYYRTLHQPAVACYIIGIGRFIGGYRRSDLNTPWDFERGLQFNERVGAVPSPGLLWWSRLPMAILGTFSIGLVFLILRTSSIITAYAWLGMVVFNPYFSLHLRRAMGESSLIFFTILTLYFLTRALASSKEMGANQKWSITRWLLLAGVTSGLAGETKLNGLVILGATFVIAVILGVLLNEQFKEKITASVWNSVGTSAMCLFAFIIINPFLWPAPFTRSLQMFIDRTRGMNRQITIYSGSYMDIGQRIPIILQRVFQDYASLPIPALFNFILVALGVWITFTSLRALLARQDFNPSYVAFLIMAFFAATPIWLSPLDWDRYYIYPVLFATIFTAIAIDWMIRTSLRMGKNFFARSSA